MRTKIAVSAVIFFTIIATAFAGQYPTPTSYVSDFAHVLSQEEGTSLNAELAAFEKKTGVEIAVVTVPWLNGQSIEDYTTGLAKEWGVGKRGKDNGVVFLVAPKERKMRIETASGARSVLTDSRADDIRDETIIPRFKAGNMAQGIIDGTHAIMRAFDETPALSATNSTESTQPASQPVSEQPASQPQSDEWTAKDTQNLG